MNFTFREVRRIDDIWGVYDENKKEWLGGIRNLINGDVDLMSANLCYSRSRKEVIDWLQPINSIDLGFIIKGKILLTMTSIAFMYILLFNTYSIK